MSRKEFLKAFEQSFTELCGIPIFYGMVTRRELEGLKIKPPFAIYTVVEDRIIHADNRNHIQLDMTLSIDINCRECLQAFDILDKLSESGYQYESDYVVPDEGLYGITVSVSVSGW